MESRKMKWLWRNTSRLVLMVLIALGIFSARLVLAQGEAGISGVVTDTSGSAIPGATVQVENTETGVIRALTTDEAGRYDATLLPIGNYKVTADKPGFQSE